MHDRRSVALFDRWCSSRKQTSNIDHYSAANPMQQQQHKAAAAAVAATAAAVATVAAAAAAAAAADLPVRIGWIFGDVVLFPHNLNTTTRRTSTTGIVLL